AARTEWLKEHHYQLLRFSNDEVLNNIEDVTKKIAKKLQETISDYKRSGSCPSSPLERGLGGEVKTSGVNITAFITEVAGETDIEKGLQKAIDAKDSVGGIVECHVTGLPVGLGEPFFDSVESVLAHAVFAIPAVKGVEFGAGFAAAKMFGTEHNDSILDDTGKTKTNHAGGIVGGIGNGNELVFRIAIKPTSSTPKEQQTWNWETKQIERFSVKGRHDLCVALRAPVILEAMTAMVLADFALLEQRIPKVIHNNV
ncbi:MAG: chorismate synthase, partial [Chitinophagaceae bacterium]|nr:chorismate synthase [Chitinophagaceae bacterium]